MLDRLYAGAARWRRRSAERHPERQRHLARPVLSVGNLSVGGTGKTPIVAALAQFLTARGERPAILSRGYKRAQDVPGVVVVSDGASITDTLARSGDEPLMLARAVPGAIVCVSPERYLAGVLAERTLGATVHILDDGFQHVALARDLDILVTSPGEIPGGRTLPIGRLREPLDAAARAQVVVVMGANPGGAQAEAWTLGISLSCGASRGLEEPVPVGRPMAPLPRPGESRVVAVCGIGNPDRFVADLKAQGWQVAHVVTFPDHHVYTPSDLARLEREVKASGASAVLTTDKDAVRFEAVGEPSFPLWRVTLRVTFDPPDVLFETVAAAMAGHRARALRGETKGEMPDSRGVS